MLFWPQPALALHAAHFGHALFAVLRCTTAILPEVSTEMCDDNVRELCSLLGRGWPGSFGQRPQAALLGL